MAQLSKLPTIHFHSYWPIIHDGWARCHQSGFPSIS